MEVPVKDVGEVVECKRPRASDGPMKASSKRIVDVVGAVLGLVLVLPVGLLIALAIKLNGRGPVLFSQTRLGRHGQCFKMLKFRTMYVESEGDLGELLRANPALRAEYETYHKLQNDPRVTWIGRLLRKFSLDELPQLWNVLKGEMSLVGPRPYLPQERHKMNGTEHVILNVTPGLTGFWQVHGRNGVRFQDRIQMDVHYLRTRSMGMDLSLMCRTVGVMLQGKDAC